MSSFHPIAIRELSAQVRDLILGAAPKGEDQERLWGAVKARVDREPFYFDDSPHPALTDRERNPTLR